MLIQLREKRGITRDRVPYEMQLAGIERSRIPSTKTLYRVEELGREPSIGTKAALAEFYGVDLHTIWRPREPRCAREVVR
jgi:transcriptional regulator with XRE-family HTH domain